MGTIRYSGNDHELSDHEGFVEAELDIVSIYGDDRWTSSSCNEHDGHATGRHRSACACGWRGPAVETGVRDVFLPEDLDDQVRDAWSEHTDPLIAALDRTGDLVDLAERYHQAEAEVASAIRRAVATGATVAEIAAALGRTEGFVVERWGYLVPVSA